MNITSVNINLYKTIKANNVQESIKKQKNIVKSIKTD